MRKILIFASVVVCLLFLTSVASASWWNVNWKYRREITITNVNGTLTDYQILVELNSTNFNFSHAQEDGSDIRFVASDDETLLSHWIEVWNSTNQSAKIWVNVSEITEGAKIFMYYGNENASDVSDVNATFIRVIDGVVGAWHFDEGNGTIAHDTSGEENDGVLCDGNTSNNDGDTPPEWISGKYNKALKYDGNDDYVNVPNSESLNMTDFTVSLWIKPYNFTNPTTGYKAHWIYKAQYIAVITTSEGHVEIRTIDNTDTVVVLTSNEAISLNMWHQITYTVTSTGEIELYIDGELDNTRTFSPPPLPNNQKLCIGSAESLDFASYGIIDEVYIWNRSLSGKEITDLYDNYGYTTPNYPNKVLVRKYTEAEPVAIVGEEVLTILSGVGKLITIEREIGANYILWKWSCTNPNALVDVFVDGSEVLSAASAVSGEYLLTDVNENELHIIKIANSFNASDYVRDEARTLPPFSFFLALLLTTFVLLVIT
ncbi:hypothetical protein DRO29_06700, partial [Candidatus Bathyarchaeota archaeon]